MMMLMVKIACLIVFGLSPALVATGPIVTRHDVPDQAYVDYAAELPVTSSVIRYNTTDVAGTLISPDWLLSAAHVAETIEPGISSGQSTSATGGLEGRYGVTESYTRVSIYRDWIDATLRDPR